MAKKWIDKQKWLVLHRLEKNLILSNLKIWFASFACANLVLLMYALQRIIKCYIFYKLTVSPFLILRLSPDFKLTYMVIIEITRWCTENYHSGQKPICLISKIQAKY